MATSTGKHHTSETNQISNVSQQFVYNSRQKGSSLTDRLSLLIFGYIHMIEILLQLDSIPNDILLIIASCYGKKYNVHAVAPNKNEFDYAIELLVPLKRLGINYSRNKICLVTTWFAKQNIILGSELIQVNNTLITDKTPIDNIGDLIDRAMQYTPSCMIFRCKKQLIEQGIHLQCNIMLNKNCNKSQRFPYYKFRKEKLQSIFKKVFVNNLIDVYQVYGDVVNGGVTILLFIDSLRDAKRDEMEMEIECNFQAEICKDCTVNIAQFMYGRKADALNRGFANDANKWNGKGWTNEFVENKIELMSLIYRVRGLDHGKDAWYLVLVDPDKLQQFQDALRDETIELLDHGYVVECGFGDDAPQSAKDLCHKLYDYAG